MAFSSLACPDWTVEQIAAAAGQIGYDGVEWRLADGSLLGPKTPGDVWRRIAFSGVPAVCLDTSCVVVGSERDKTVRYVAVMGERAADIGAPAIRVFGGVAREGSPVDDALVGARETLADAAAAMPDGIRIIVETHDAWSTGKSLMQLVRGLDVGVLWDVAHTVRSGETVAATLDEIGRPELVHMKDARGETLTPLGEGDVPLGGALAALRSRGYDGWVSFEWEKLWHPELAGPEVALPHAAAFLRSLLGVGFRAPPSMDTPEV